MLLEGRHRGRGEMKERELYSFARNRIQFLVSKVQELPVFCKLWKGQGMITAYNDSFSKAELNLGAEPTFTALETGSGGLA